MTNTSITMTPNDVCIVASARTPIGSFGGSLSSVPATSLGAHAIEGCFHSNPKLHKDQVLEVFMGNVLSANVGQAPARQAALGAGLPTSVICTTVNKVCSSGMKAIMFGAMSIMMGQRSDGLVVCGGMENMSQVPHYLPDQRFGKKFGDSTVVDGLNKDGLFDVYNKIAMGSCAEICARKYGFTREQQDDFAVESYKRAIHATKEKIFEKYNEIVPVVVKDRKGQSITITEDEGVQKVDFEKMRSLRPAFEKDGTVTAGNASSMNDGAAAVVLCSAEYAQKHGLDVEFVIRSFDDAEQASELFTTSPAKAISAALKRIDLAVKDIDTFELNEAFAVVGLANMQLTGIEHSKLNIFGGGCSLGHPLGASGARIIATLLTALKHTNGKRGAAGICNGGGGASAMVIERITSPWTVLRSKLN